MDAILAAFQGLAHNWEQDVAHRRRISERDPVTDTLEYCASELAAEVARLREDLRYLTPEQYAEARGGGVTGQTIRNWVNAGELDGVVRGPRGWLIPAYAERRKKNGAGTAGPAVSPDGSAPPPGASA